MATTFSPDPVHLKAGAGTAAQQSAEPRLYADHVNGGWDVAATGATAGTPGNFTPAGSVVPANLAAMAGVTATPATAWTGAAWVDLADGSDAWWNGSAWVAGRAPVTARSAGRAAKDDHEDV